MNFLASLGQEKFRCRVTHRAAMTCPGVRALDAAADTGTGAIEFMRAEAGAVAVDSLQGMIHKEQVRYPEFDFQQADAMNPRFMDNFFDMVIISFGLCNVADLDQALREFCQALYPDEYLVVCGFPRPTWMPFRTLYRLSLGAVLPPIACLVSSDAVAYDYLTEPILVWPS